MKFNIDRFSLILNLMIKKLNSKWRIQYSGLEI